MPMTPFDLLRQEFVQNAFLSGTIIAFVSGIVGYFIILRGQAFATETLSHVGFAGAAGAALIGVNSLVGMFFLTVITATGMGALGKRLKGRDVEVGMVLSFMLGLGVLFLSLYTQNASHAVNLFFGSILSVTREDVMITLGSSTLVIITLIVLYRPLLFASLDPVVAEARGVPVQFLSILFLLVLALTVSQAVEVVGTLLVFALLIVPAASALAFNVAVVFGVDPGRCDQLVFHLGWAGTLLDRSPTCQLLYRCAHIVILCFLTYFPAFLLSAQVSRTLASQPRNLIFLE